MSPLRDVVDDTSQRPPRVRELVDDTHWWPWLHISRHHAGGLELTQPLGQQTVGQIGNACQQLVEAARAVQEDVHDDAQPPAADKLDGALNIGTPRDGSSCWR